MRDKLIEILYNGFHVSPKDDLNGVVQKVADYLIAHGVTFAEDNNVPCKWIPVEEELPETIHCTAGTAYSNAVNALTSGRKVITAIFDGEDFIGDAAFWDAEDEVITHWAPVLLPLPAAPKEE